MTTNNIPETSGKENSVGEEEAQRDHQLNLSVTKADWDFIEEHAERMLPRHPNRRVIPRAMAAYEIFSAGRAALQGIAA